MKLFILSITFCFVLIFSANYSQGLSCDYDFYQSFALVDGFDSSNKLFKKELKLLKSTELDYFNDSTNFRVAYLKMRGYAINNLKPIDLIDKAIEIDPLIPEYYFLKALILYNNGMGSEDAIMQVCPLISVAMELMIDEGLFMLGCFQSLHERCQ